MGSSKPEQLIDLVFARLSSDVERRVGRRETETHGRPPRVVAVPVGSATMDQPDRAGYESFGEVSGVVYPLAQARALGYSGAGFKMRRYLIRRFEIEWHCFGAPRPELALGPDDRPDFTQAEALLEALVVAIRTEIHHSVRFSGETWVDQQEGGDSFMRHGTVITFKTEIDIPVMSKRSGLTYLTATPPALLDASMNDEPVPVGT